MYGKFVWRYDGLLELISKKISIKKHSSDEQLSPDVLFSRTFWQTTYSPYYTRDRTLDRVSLQDTGGSI